MKNVAGYDEYYNINTAKNNTCSFFKLPKILFIDEKLKNLSPEAKILYSILCDLTSLSSKMDGLMKMEISMSDTLLRRLVKH